jgi:hypothetical protein
MFGELFITMMDFEASDSPNFVIAILGGKAIRLKSENWTHVITTMEMTRINYCVNKNPAKSQLRFQHRYYGEKHPADTAHRRQGFNHNHPAVDPSSNRAFAGISLASPPRKPERHR